MADSSLGWREWFAVLLWRAWKYLIHVVTGKCEVQRICDHPYPLHLRSVAISDCLKRSRDPELRRVGRDGGIPLDEAVATIVRAKKINEPQSSFLARLRPSLLQITSLNTVRADTAKLRADNYCQDNSEHEDMLMEVWSHLSPTVPLETRLTNQWGDIGFQGNNPATDFRGMGVLGLRCLLFFSSQCTGHARSVLSLSQHTVRGYPFAIVGINLTALLYKWLHDGTTDHHYYFWVADREVSLNDFLESYCYVFHQFNTHWVEEKPDNVMAFPAVKERYAAILRDTLTQTPPTLMKIGSE